MIKDILFAIGPFGIVLGAVLTFFTVLIALSWIAYFTARSWKRGMLA